MRSQFGNPMPAYGQSLSFGQSQLKPYENQEFLDNIFHFKDEYIEAFHTLPHQLKLKFYLSIEEMKMLGNMSDRPGYESILQEITRRVLIIHPDMKKKSSNPQNSDKSQQWKNKMQHLVEDHLKKIQKDDLLDDLPIGNINSLPKYRTDSNIVDFLSGEVEVKGVSNGQGAGKNYTSLQLVNENGDDDDQFEWSEPSDQIISQQTNVQNQLNTNFSKKTSLEPQYQPDDQQEWQWNESQPAEEIKTAAEPAKPIDVWDIVVDEENSPKKQQAEQKQQQTAEHHQPIQLIEAAYSNPDISHQAVFSEDSSYLNQPSSATTPEQHMPQINFQKKTMSEEEQNPHQQEEDQGFQWADEPHSATIPHPTDNLLFFGGREGEEAQRNPSPGISTSSNRQEMYPSQEFEVEMPPLVPNPIQSESRKESMPEMPNLAINNHLSDHKKDDGFGDDDEFQWQGSSSVEKPEDNKGSSSSPQLRIINEQGDSIKNQDAGQKWEGMVSVANSNLMNENSMNEDPTVKNLDPMQPYLYKSSVMFTEEDLAQSGLLNFNPKNASPEKTQAKSPSKHPQSSPKKTPSDFEQSFNDVDDLASSGLLPHTDFHDQLLNGLLCKVDPEPLLSQMKKNGFQYDREFYKKAIGFLEKLGYEQHKHFQFLKEQQNVCNQIFRLTELYTAAVDQDEEELVIKTLKETKNMYSQLKPKKIIHVIEKFVDLKGKGARYQMGKLALEAGVPRDLMQKAIKSPKFQEVITAMYVVEAFGSIQNNVNLAKEAIQYLEAQYSLMEKLAKELTELPQPVQNIIVENPKFKDYRTGLSSISFICKRAVILGKMCSSKDLHPNMLKIYQRIKELSFEHSTQHDDNIIIPDSIVHLFSRSAKKTGTSVYSLHALLSEQVKSQNLCLICLLPDGQHHQNGKTYHHNCWNFQEQMRKYKNSLMPSMGGEQVPLG